jgi:hypothetical protein
MVEPTLSVLAFFKMDAFHSFYCPLLLLLVLLLLLLLLFLLLLLLPPFLLCSMFYGEFIALCSAM